MARPDAVRSIYFLAFEVDERLGDRLAAHKRSGKQPGEALPLPLPLTAEFSRDRLVATLLGDAPFTTVPHGRRLRGPRVDAPHAAIALLAAALVPLPSATRCRSSSWTSDGGARARPRATRPRQGPAVLPRHRGHMAAQCRT